MQGGCSNYLASLGYENNAELRVGALHFQRLVRPGAIVRTSYNSGPYVVVSTHRRWRRDADNRGKVRLYEHWSIVCDRPVRDGPKWPQPTAWLNEYCAIGRRILSTYSDDEVFVVGFSEDAAKVLAPKPKQLELF